MPKIPPGTTVTDMTQQSRTLSGQNAAPPRPGFWQRVGQTLANIVDPTGPQPAAETPVTTDEASADPSRLPVAGDSALGNRDFGPLTPLNPRNDPNSPEQTQGARQFQYPFGSNIIVTPRAEQPALLTPFEQLRNLSALYDVAAMCIGARIEEAQGLDWSVMAKNKREQLARQDDCDEATAFFQSPDRVNDFQSWLGILLYDLFSIDAMTLYRRPDLAGRLYSLDPVDGSTIKPLLDDRGRTLAYQQVLYGYPFSDYKRPSADAPDEKFPTYSRNQLIYKPRWVRTFTPYGFPPTEWVILRVNTALRKQAFDMSYFTSGNIPDMIATPPEGTLNPEQVQQFEENFNALLEGKDDARRKVRFFAWNMNIRELQKFEYNTILDDWMMRITCAAYGVPPNELGFTESVNRATAEIQQAVNDRRGLRPLTKWLAKAVLEPAIFDYGGRLPAVSVPGRPTLAARNRFDGLHWQWQFGDAEDAQALATTHGLDIQNGVISPDESRAMRYGSELDGPAPKKPDAGLAGLLSGQMPPLPPMVDTAARPAPDREPATPAPAQAPVTRADVAAIVKEVMQQAASKGQDGLGKTAGSKPTPDQISAGNYAKGHVKFQGFEVTIENPAGSTRTGADSQGREWSVFMRYPYGYIRRTEGQDGEHVDVYLGTDEDAENVYIVHQADPSTGDYDEDKVMLGFGSEILARAAYLAQYQIPGFMGALSALPVSLFREIVFDKTRPALIPDAAERVAANKTQASADYAKTGAGGATNTTRRLTYEIVVVDATLNLHKLMGSDGIEYHRGSYRACDGKRAKLKKEARAGDTASPFRARTNHAVDGNHQSDRGDHAAAVPAHEWSTYG